MFSTPFSYMKKKTGGTISLSGLQMYFGFENNVNDTSGNSRNLTVNAGALTYSTTTKKFGSYSAVYTSDDNIIRTSTLGFTTGKGTGDKFSFTGWMYPTQDIPNNLDRYRIFETVGDTQANNVDVAWYVWNNSGTKSLMIDLYYGSRNRQYTSYTLSLNTWYFFASILS